MADEEMLPSTDLVLGIKRAMTDLATTVLTAQEVTQADNAGSQIEYPLIVVQLPIKNDTADYRNAQVGRYTAEVDLYWSASEQFDLLDTLDEAENTLKRLPLYQHPCMYVRGTASRTQPVTDTTTAVTLLHGTISLTYQIYEIYLTGGKVNG